MESNNSDLEFSDHNKEHSECAEDIDGIDNNGYHHEEASIQQNISASAAVVGIKKSLRSPKKRKVYSDEAHIDSDGEELNHSSNHNDDEEEDEDQLCLSAALPALRKYFFERLLQVVLFLGGSKDSVKGWRVAVTKKEGGLTMGQLSVEYISGKDRRFRSRVEAACHLGLMSTAKNLRSMSRDQLYINAIETRERMLISQQLLAVNCHCEEVQFLDDVITVRRTKETENSRSGKHLFSFGNTTVLSWGCILPDNLAFHTSTQIYPLGFRCVRQEHDLVLDRVVDCLCEIDGIYEQSAAVSAPQTGIDCASRDPVDGVISQRTAKNLLPLFRITVSWKLAEDAVCVRVYEGRSPQQAWQAAMLEQVGLPGVEVAGLVGPRDSAAAESGDVGEGPCAFQRPDAEELALRAEIREQRRLYFRTLRQKQSLGLQPAVRPRFSVEQFDSLGDELLLRMVEGMEGSIACTNYIFLDSRCGDRESGRKCLLKAQSKMFAKAKQLDRVLCRTEPTATAAGSCETACEGSPLLPATTSGSRKRKVDESADMTRKLLKGRPEDKELRALTANFLKSRAARVKEVERGITLLKAAMVRDVKKRRDDARMLVEAICAKEQAGQVLVEAPLAMAEKEQSIHSATELTELASIPRPRSAGGDVMIDGVVAGQLLEVWECLNTFGPVLGVSKGDVPTISKLLGSARACDPSYRILRTYMRGLRRTFEFAASQASAKQGIIADLSVPEATAVLNSVGVALTRPLVGDYERLFGLDLVEASTADVRVPVNELTWREVARSVLLAGACREVGVADTDTAVLLKGRGFYTTPESADRKALKLARRRVAYSYTVRDEFQESVYGFAAGQCIRLPAPADAFHSSEVVWTELVGALAQVPDHKGWLIYEVIQAAAMSACAVDSSLAARRLKKTLLECLGPDLLSADDGSRAKQAALSMLSSQFNRGSSAAKPGPATLDDSADEHAVQMHLYDRIRLLYDFSPDMPPLCSSDLWEKQARETVRRAAPLFIQAAAALQDERGDEEEDDAGASVECAGSVAMEVQADCGAEASGGLPSPDGDEEAEPDMEQAKLLSVAMQRCYLVLRDLMISPHAQLFLQPVDAAQLPAYYRFASQPLSLTEIRFHLVGGGYADSLTAFYGDVSLLLENAMAFNQETSPARTAAQRLQTVFERLFFETVICWDHPLPFHDSCPVCRAADPACRQSGKVAVCDRCEGCYHLSCLDPPMFVPPRSEWYCLPCVEQRGIANAHPYKTADVRHPTDPEAAGEVVAIEQLQQTAVFVVQFGAVREMWSGTKVRKYAVTPIDEEDAAIAVSEMAGAENTRSSFVAARTPLVVAMPSGYSYEDYDRVCGKARAYTGWGGSHYLTPPLLLDEHSLAARDRATVDPMFDIYRRAVAALAAPSTIVGSQQGGGSEDYCASTGMQDWATVLRALLQRALESPAMGAALSAAEDDLHDEYAGARILDCVQSGNCSLETLAGLLVEDGVSKKKRGETLTLLVGSAAVRKGESRTEEDGDSDEDDELLFPSTSRRAAASSSVARRRIQEEGDEEDEAEFDELCAPSAGWKSNGEEANLNGRGATDRGDDEEEEDDLDLFDDEGRCLTSAGGSSRGLADRPKSALCLKNGTLVSENSTAWEVRQLSRQKGREDALLTQVLVSDVLTSLDVDGVAEAEGQKEAGFAQMWESLQQGGATFYRGALSSIVKACMGRPSESLVIDDWLLGWEHKMAVIIHRHQESVGRHGSEVDVPVCQLCGFEESFLGSPFVRAMSAEEYQAHIAAEGAPVTQEDDSATGGLSASLLLGLQPGGGVFTSTGIKGFRARSRAVKGLVWQPVDEDDARTEREECAAMHRPLISGSVIAHECCADFLHFGRQQSQGRHQTADNEHVVEVLLGLGRGKTASLGTDRTGHRYWALLSCPGTLFVSGGGQSENGGTTEEVPSNMSSATSTWWHAYSQPEDIALVAQWLDGRLPSERQLKRLVLLLFPSASAAKDSAAMDVVLDAPVAAEERTAAAEGVDKLPSGSDRDESASEGEEDENEVEDEDVDDDEDQRTSSSSATVNRLRRGHQPQSDGVDGGSSASLVSMGATETIEFRKGELVLARPAENRILWDARVLESRLDADSGQVLYKLHFQQWPAAYDGWYSAGCLMSAATAAAASRGAGTRALVAESRREYLRRHVEEAPPILQSLAAYAMMGVPNRAAGDRPPLSFSDSRSSAVAMLRTALLMLEAALPLGAVDEAEDRWGDNFAAAWRHAVCASADAAALMQCQILLEYGIRTAWLKPAGLKVLSCLPSRALCLRNATVGAVAVRVWVLDQTIRYDKITAAGEKDSRKSAGGGKSSGSRHKAKAAHYDD